MDQIKRRQLTTILSWGIGVGIAFLIVGKSTWSIGLGCGLLLICSGALIILSFQKRQAEKR